jgi:hypothetical protein
MATTAGWIDVSEKYSTANAAWAFAAASENDVSKAATYTTKAATTLAASKGTQVITGLQPTIALPYDGSINLYTNITVTAYSYRIINGIKTEQQYNLPSYDLSLSAISYNPTVATVDSITGIVSALDVGSANITVSQAGNAYYLDTSASTILTAGKATQTITVDSSFNKTYGTSSFNLGASTSSGLQLSYSTDASNIATVDGSGNVTIKNAGTANIIVTQPGNAYYLDASASTILRVAKVSQSITVDSSFNLVYGVSSFNLGASTTSGLQLSYSTDASNVATVSTTGQVTIKNTGTANINVTQLGNTNYLDASASTILTVGKATPTITVDSSFNKLLSDGSFNLGATSSNSTVPLTYSSDASNVATVSTTGQVTIKNTGTANINVTQLGNTNYLDGSASTILTIVATVPSAPTITGVIVNINDNDASNNTYSKVDVSFNVPVSNGGSSITNYQYSINDASFVTLTPPQVSTPLTITYTFMANSSYNIKIRAVNVKGEGASSPISNFNFSVPSAPVITKVTAKDSKATIHFTVSSNNSSTITKYEVSRDGGASYLPVTNVTINGTTGKIELTDLSELTTFSFAIRAINGVGSGDASEPLQLSNVCFLAGTPIQTNQGEIAIEKIDPKIHTIRNKKICHITRTITQDKYLVCIEKNALGNNIPSEKTIISKNHCIWYNGKMIAAKHFVNNFENVKKVKYQGDVLYNVLMEEADKMMVNNLICETLDPANIISKVYNLTIDNTKKEKRYIINKLNEYVVKYKM